MSAHRVPLTVWLPMLLSGCTATAFDGRIVDARGDDGGPLGDRGAHDLGDTAGTGDAVEPGSTNVVIPFAVNGEIPVTRIEAEEPRRMWEASIAASNGDPRPQTLGVNDLDQLFGSDCLQTIVTGGSAAGSMFTWYLTNTGFNYIWYMREFLADPDWGGSATWQLRQYNRMRFWYRPPDEIVQADPVGSSNFHVGTYLRGTDAPYSNQESDNGHFYHYYNIPPLGGGWAQVFIDPHPSHQRGDSGSVEHGWMVPGNPAFDAFSGSTTHNYFDLMTNFYVTERHQNSDYPSVSLVDGFELYHASDEHEDLDHVYQLWAGVDLSRTPVEIVIGWKRDKAEDDKTFHLKYAFSSFQANGGFANHGRDAPNGLGVDPPNVGGYNGVEYRVALGAGESQIDATDLDSVFFAIQHQDETVRFREIRIPLTSNGYPDIGAL